MFDMFKMFTDPTVIEKLARKLRHNPELRKIYEETIKEKPELEDDLDALVRHIFPGEPPNE